MTVTAVPLASAERDRLVRRARLLAWSSLAWNDRRGGHRRRGRRPRQLGCADRLRDRQRDRGSRERHHHLALLGSRTLSESAERKAQKLVAISFFLLAPYIAFEAVRALVTSSEPKTSWLGIALTVSSAIAMPFFGLAKQRVGAKLNSAATAGEGTQNLICAYLAVGVLVGLLANTVFGLWWLDPVIALGIAGLALHEGREAWRGEDCC